MIEGPAETAESPGGVRSGRITATLPPMLVLPEHLVACDPLPLHPRLGPALARGPEAVSALLEPVGPDVFRVPLLDPDWSRELAEEVAGLERRARALGVRPPAPNSMHGYGLLGADLALDPLLAQLVARVVVPLTSDRFPEVGAGTLDHHHGFVVHYGTRWDRDLALHVDDSEVTVNVCLGRSFDGGELLMSGRRCGAHLQTRARPGERVALAQEPGFALIHAGMHRHEALPVTRGERLNLILWCRSSAFRRGPRPACPPWCDA